MIKCQNWRGILGNSMELQFDFNFDRTLQAAAHLLKLANRQEMKYIHLLKLLYIADREYLAERGYLLTGDNFVALEHGPVPSTTFGLIKSDERYANRESISKWHLYIQTLPKSYMVRLISDPSDDDLSRASMSKLNDVFSKHGNLPPFQVVDLTHDFLEWQKYYHPDSPTPIPLTAILQAQGAEKMLVKNVLKRKSPIRQDRICC